MRTIMIVCLLILLSSFFSSCNNSQTMPFNTIDIGVLPAETPSSQDPVWNYHGHIVQIRGFWYPLSTASQSVLTLRPHLKNCCIGTPLKIGEQIFVYGEIIALMPGQVVSLTGIFTIEPCYSAEGMLTQLYVLNILGNK